MDFLIDYFLNTLLDVFDLVEACSKVSSKNQIIQAFTSNYTWDTLYFVFKALLLVCGVTFSGNQTISAITFRYETKYYRYNFVFM